MCYIYIYIYLGGAARLGLLVQYGLACLCVVRRVEDHYDLIRCSPLLKKACVGQVVLDKQC